MLVVWDMELVLIKMLVMNRVVKIMLMGERFVSMVIIMLE